jgi:ubiquitin-conjugating enzyme E2 Z
MSPTAACLKRIQKELRDVHRDPMDGIFVTCDESNVTRIHALVVGPFETPYAGGFFYFVLDLPDDYPHQPPKATLMTTDGGRVRFNPNLYADGKVCLSILGTWAGPGWSPTLSISSVLISIQSLMNHRPFCNEPGFETSASKRDIDLYNECVAHETIRVAVCDVLEEGTTTSRALPEAMRLLARDVGPGFFDQHIETCEKHMAKDGTAMVDPHSTASGSAGRGNFQWSRLKQRILALQAVLGGDLEE